VDHEWPAPGSLLSLRYRLTAKLATSGMSEIWQANDELLGRAVAIKLPRPRAAAILPEAWIEARTTAQVSHPHIAAVHDYGESPRPDGTVVPYVVMELLDGESLAARLARGPLAWPDAARIGAEVASGLAAAHARKVVHRDIKPGNIMLTPTGTKILDFGISAVAGAPDDDETGATFGTPAYTAPERLNGTPAAPATDMYSLGTVLFEMVTGEPPYPVDTWEEFAAARAKPPAVLPDGLPQPFRDLVERCLAEEPTLRPDAAEVLHRLATLRPPEAPPRPVVRAAARRPSRAVVRVAVAALLVLAGAAVALVSWSTGGETPRAVPNRTGPTPPAPTPTAGAPQATPTSASASARATTAASPPPSSATADPAIGLDEAVDSMISTVEAGQAAGDIRPDVAVDLINLLRQLDDTPPADVGRRVADLQQKINVRSNEGTLARPYAEELRSILNRVART
jgi:hypothetical protein